jgi:hypothetical protein
MRSSSLWVGFVFLVHAVGCGGASKEAVPAAEPVPAAPAPSPLPAPAPPIACRAAGAACTEYRDAPVDRAAEIRDQCTKSGGEALAACPTENLAGTCTVQKPPMTVISSVYRSAKPAKLTKKAKSVLEGIKKSCESNGGTFSPGG